MLNLLVVPFISLVLVLCMFKFFFVCLLYFYYYYYIFLHYAGSINQGRPHGHLPNKPLSFAANCLLGEADPAGGVLLHRGAQG